MRTKAKKRKVIPIVATVTIPMEEYQNNPQASGQRASDELCKILGRKVFEFCRKEVSFQTAEADHVEVRADIRVLDMGKEFIWRRPHECKRRRFLFR